MNASFRVYGYERYRFTRNVVGMLAIALVSAAILTVTMIVFNVDLATQRKTEERYPYQEVDAATRDAVLADYAAELPYLEDYVRQARFVDAPEAVILRLENEYALCRFYVATGTIASDYLEPDRLDSPTYGHHGTAFPFFALDVFRYALFLFAALSGMAAFGSEYRSGTLRDLVGAPVRRKHILAGKTLRLLVITTVACAAFDLIALLAGAAFGLGDAEVVVVSGTACRAMPVLLLFQVRVAAVWIGMLLISAIAVLAGIVTRSAVASLLVPAGVYALFHGLFQITLSSQQAVYPGLDPAILATTFPLVSLDYHLQAWSGTFWLLASYHAVLIAVLLAAALALFKRQTV